ncbi:MAG: saccharopine dehydrogenase family protein [candidate division WOR-3 bacterium]|nr:saccharopine dehydrogenase family protein [candidate division WOR-3 bacterium]
MKILILGCGMQGRVVAEDLSRSYSEITVLDIDKNNLDRLKRPNIKKIQFDINDKKRLIRLMSDYDLLIGALPARFGFFTMECAVETGVDLIDMSYSSVDPFLLDKDAKAAGIRIVPDAGYAPGLSNILVGEAFTLMDGIESLKIMVGGIPQKPLPPFNYRITWSPEDLIEEYTRPARIYKNYKIITVPALTGIEEFNVPKIGKLEALYTDGLRTLLKTMSQIKNMEEKTIRYPGHALLFKTLIDCGFLSRERVKIKNFEISCYDFTINYLKEQLTRGPEYDITILIIEIKNRNKRKRYCVIDYYDKKNKITSMARMTGYTCSIIARCIKDYPHHGIIPPEFLGMEPKFCTFIKKELRRRGVRGL